MIFDIVNGANIGRSNIVSCNDLINFYPEIEDPSKSKHPKALISCPGYRLAVTAYSSGQGRGIFTTSTDRMFTVISNQLIEISTLEAATSRGTILTSSGMCVMSDNGSQLLIVDGTYGYIFTLATNVLARITDAQFPAGPTHCIFTDGYFLVNSSGTGQFYFSASYDGTSWAALDFATAEYSSDSLQGIVKTSNGTIWMLGKQSIELWQNVGVAELPWRRISGSVKEIGCIAPYSIASNGNQIFWLGNGQNGYAAVHMGNGYEVTRISSPAIEYQIKQMVNIQNAEAFVYSDEGHSFYAISFSSEKTFVYDTVTGEWHRRGSYNTLTGFNIRQFANGCAFFNKKLYVGSYLNGNIYEMSLDLLDEAGNEIKREIFTGNIQEDNKLLWHSKFELDVERGVGTNTTTSPSIMLRFSNDGGRTWSNETTVSPGAIGKYSKRCLWLRLGKSRNRSYCITFSDAVKWYITRAFVEVR